MTEAEFRAAIAAEAKTWIGTPYRGSCRMKGVGCNCAQFLFGVAKGAGVIPADSPEPRFFTAEFAAHTKEERVADYIRSYGGVEIPESAVKTGDIILYRNGQAHGHAAIVLDWPNVIHVMPGHGCQLGLVNEGRMGGLNRWYFTLWKA